MFASELMISGFQKCHLNFCAVPRNAKNCNSKKWRHSRLRFLGYMFAKNRYISLKFGMPDDRTWFNKLLYISFKNLEFGFWKKNLLKNFSFLLFGYFLGKSEIAILENSLFYGFCSFSFAFCLKCLYLVIFQTFFNFRP